MSSFLRLSGRYDGGDGITGGGAEVAAGLKFNSDRFTGEIKGRYLRAFEDGEKEETGVSAVLNLKGRSDGTGLSFTLVPEWGNAEASPFELWGAERIDALNQRALYAERDLMVNSKLSWGQHLERRNMLVSPFVSYVNRGMGEDVSLGVALDGRLSFEMAVTRRQTLAQGLDHMLAIKFRLNPKE